MWLRISKNYADLHLIITLMCLAHGHPAVKVVGIALLFGARSSWWIRIGRLGVFYLLIFTLGLCSVLYLFETPENYTFVLSLGLLFWMICLFMHSKVYTSVVKHSPAYTERSLLIFFYITFLVSCWQYLQILWKNLQMGRQGILFFVPIGSAGDAIRAIYTFSSDAMVSIWMLFTVLSI